MQTRKQENFIVQIWYGTEKNKETRIRVQHVLTEKTMVFTNFSNLMYFFEHFLDDKNEIDSISGTNLK
ncbi:MAG: hypothetical protein JEZ00_10090 [Anaerolineaceae bacterium]|nr:hypothetical protein [Anaerolineaceae bacterium]